MIPDVLLSCWQAVWGLPGKGFASGRKYLNSSNDSTSTDRPVPLQCICILGLPSILW